MNNVILLVPNEDRIESLQIEMAILVSKFEEDTEQFEKKYRDLEKIMEKLLL